jgi:hypothetical protein
VAQLRPADHALADQMAAVLGLDRVQAVNGPVRVGAGDADAGVSVTAAAQANAVAALPSALLHASYARAWP